ncbi:NAD(P)H-quinone oxidoreductase [Sporobolomyces koalae]|uniref:NAD(P)H-quinone oxidoreductase n=1 Tax=Sporobolomyces koalae TaxID=500713 RepID=UPI00317E0617
MVQMKAILVKDGKSDTAEGLYLGEFERPTLKKGDGKVIVKIKAFGLNRMDIMQRQGKYPLPPGASPIIGVEFSGTIEEAGESEFQVGEEVFGLATGGAYAEYIATPASMVVRKPSHVSWVQAAAVMENWLTAYQALFTISEMRKGQSVLVHAGASGVGIAAIQLAKAFGAELVIATAGTDEKVRFVEQHGAKGVNYKTQNFADEVKKLTEEKGVDIVIDFIGASYWEKNIQSLGRDGRMVLLGLMGGIKTENPLDLSQILYKRLRIEGTTLRSRSLEYQGKLLQDFSKEALGKVFAKAKGEEGLDLVIHKVYDWNEIKDAHTEMEQAKNIGKIICTIDA